MASKVKKDLLIDGVLFPEWFGRRCFIVLHQIKMFHKLLEKYNLMNNFDWLCNKRT